MTLLTSLYSGASGLETNSLDLTVVGDNIANGNTIGFKGSRAVFADALSQSLLGGGGETGLGTKLTTVQKIFSQGSLLNTGVTTDLAIQGSGFFIVKGTHGGKEGSFYTRAGQFTVDKQGYMTNLEGLRVQGFGADATGKITNDLGDLRPGTATSPPKATGNITLGANLQADAAAFTTGNFDPNDPSNTSNFSTSTTIFDSLGVSHQVDIYFRKTAAGAWEWHALADSAGFTTPAPTAGQSKTEIGTGTLTFGPDGTLTAPTTNPTATFTPAGAAQQTLTFDFTNPDRGLTQFAAPSAASFLNQDGYASGQLASVQVDAQGIVTGVFTNGQTTALGQVALADFPAEDQLQRAGSNLFDVTPGAGEPVVGKPSTGGRGSVYSGALEQSNVNLSQEFIKMIAAQRSFQANSKTINTADQLLSEIIALKRG
jgi:flagellar hook protein FlgE